VNEGTDGAKTVFSAVLGTAFPRKSSVCLNQLKIERITPWYLPPRCLLSGLVVLWMPSSRIQILDRFGSRLSRLSGRRSNYPQPPRITAQLCAPSAQFLPSGPRPGAVPPGSARFVEVLARSRLSRFRLLAPPAILLGDRYDSTASSAHGRTSVMSLQYDRPATFRCPSRLASSSSSGSRFKDHAREERRMELYRGMAINGHHQIVSDTFPEQPSARVLRGTEDSAIKWSVAPRGTQSHGYAALSHTP
jgi:hypothetical protein